MNTEIIEEKQNKKTKSNILEKTQSIINYSKREINNFKNGKKSLKMKEMYIDLLKGFKNIQVMLNYILEKKELMPLIE